MSEIEQALAQMRMRAMHYRKYAEYYNGDQPLAFATDKFRNAFGNLFREFAYNLCAPVIDTISDRLEVTGFGVEQGDAGLAEQAKLIWQANRMDIRAGEVHQEALRAGDAFVIVQPDANGQPVIWPQSAGQVCVQYDEETPGVISWAAKCWKAGDKIRLNIYYPDRLEKFVTANKSEGIPEKAAAFVPYEDQPVISYDYGIVPVFHFANNSSIGQHGRSELRNVIPIQDALNKSICDMLVAMEFVAYPQRYATGLEVDIDPDTGKPKPVWVPGPDRVWQAENTDTKFGEFPGADLTKILAVINDFEQKVCRIAGVPPHYMALITDPPSGEALKTLEARMVKKCRDRQASFGNDWEDAMKLALQISGVTVDARLSTQWADPAPKTEKEAGEIAILHENAGVSKRQALLELGYGAQDVDRMLAENQAERALATPALGNPFAGAA